MASILAFFRRLLRALGFGRHEPAAHAAPAPKPPPHETAEPKLGGVRPGPVVTTQAMPLLVATDGVFPGRGDAGSTPYFTLGMVQTFAGFGSAFGAPRAEGRAFRS
ncbi:MAG: hypothetical protein JO276_09575 [Sphingomonadaceae bacterium]|nr:hypothetical protein [Sphingomonadaceae bacterium]